MPVMPSGECCCRRSPVFVRTAPPRTILLDGASGWDRFCWRMGDPGRNSVGGGLIQINAAARLLPNDGAWHEHGLRSSRSSGTPWRFSAGL